MSKEIVQRLLAQKSKMVFESTEVSVPEDEEDLILSSDSDTELNIEEEEEVIPTEDSQEEVNIPESDTTNKTCICGSSNIVEEEGKLICNECGRDISMNELSEPLLPRDSDDIDESTEERMIQLRNVVAIWKQGKYQRAMELCKRYNISDKEFAIALGRSFRESTESEGDTLDESNAPKEVSKEEGLENESDEFYTVPTSTPANKLGMNLSTVEEYGDLSDMEDEYIKDAREEPNLYNYSYASVGTATRESKRIKEDADVEILSPNPEDNLGKNIIRAIQTPVTTAKKPSLDAAIMEAMTKKKYYVSYKETQGKFKGKYVDKEYIATSREEAEKLFKREHPDVKKFDYKVIAPPGINESVERTYTESELINFLKNSTTSPVYIRTSYIKAGWDDVQFAAGRAGYKVSKLIGRKDILRKLGLSGNFADFYQFTKKNYKYMQESADVDTSKWSYSTGKSHPSGRGIWFFKIGDKEVEYSGMYTECKKKAIQYAKQRGVQSIILLP